MEFADREDKTLRSKVADIKVGHLFSRVYNVPPEALSTVPVRGDVMPGYAAAEGEHEALKPRVSNVTYRKQKDGANQQVILTFIQPVAL